MKKESPDNSDKLSEQIASNKKAFRQHQRNLSFDEKMKIAFSLAKRDASIRRAVLLSKVFENKESQ